MAHKHQIQGVTVNTQGPVLAPALTPPSVVKPPAPLVVAPVLTP